MVESKEGTGAEAGRVSLWRGDWREPPRGSQDVFRPLSGKERRRGPLVGGLGQKVYKKDTDIRGDEDDDEITWRGCSEEML